MSVLGGVLLYAAGIVTGAGALALHIHDVNRAVKAVERRKDTEITKLKAACERLHEDMGMLQQSSDCADAFRRGKTAGRAQPMSDAERFARTFEGKKAAFVDTSKKGA